MSNYNTGDPVLQFLDDGTRIALEDMLTLSGFSMNELVALVEHGAFDPEGASIEAWTFSARSAFVARRAAGLRSEFGLDTTGTSLVFGLLERIEELERRLREMECQLLR
jgi:chaperone modulatory protein CbpM